MRWIGLLLCIMVSRAGLNKARKLRHDMDEMRNLPGSTAERLIFETMSRLADGRHYLLNRSHLLHIPLFYRSTSVACKEIPRIHDLWRIKTSSKQASKQEYSIILSYNDGQHLHVISGGQREEGQSEHCHTSVHVTVRKDCHVQVRGPCGLWQL